MQPAIKRLTLLREKAWPNAESRRMAAVQLVADLKQVARAAGLEARRLEDKNQPGITIAFPTEANIAVAVTIQTTSVGDILVWHDNFAQQPTRLQIKFDAVLGVLVPGDKGEPLDELAEAAAEHLEKALRAKGVKGF